MISMTKQVDYALQLLFALAKQPSGQLLSLRQFADDSGISFLFLQKIARLLKSAQIISAVQGPKGGYMLEAPLKTLTLKSVVEAVDGPVGVAACMRTPGSCEQEAQCTTKHLVQDFNTEVLKFLEETTIDQYVPR
jgi:Rrf2 family protein